LGEQGIGLNQEQLQIIFNYFDRNKNGSVDYDEFLRGIRGELTEYRKTYIRKAYEKLDKNKDGKVTLEDIAKIYDVSYHPDIVSGKMTPEQVYKQFMSLWDTQIADCIIHFEEFCDYYKDVSASIDTDEYFGVMMKNAWRLDE